MARDRLVHGVWQSKKISKISHKSSLNFNLMFHNCDFKSHNNIFVQYYYKMQYNFLMFVTSYLRIVTIPNFFFFSVSRNCYFISYFELHFTVTCCIFHYKSFTTSLFSTGEEKKMISISPIRSVTNHEWTGAILPVLAGKWANYEWARGNCASAEPRQLRKATCRDNWDFVRFYYR